MVEPKLTILSPEALAKAGYDCPPMSLPAVQELRPAKRRTKRDRTPRALREAQRQMLYHWF
jgi:hypothetical protein